MWTRWRSAFLSTGLALISSLYPNVQAATFYVAHSGDGSDGQSWETAFNTITAAVVTASTSDTIQISAETYVENITLATPVTLLGGFDPASGSVIGGASKTIVDGDQEGSVFRIVNTTVGIGDFEITNGKASEGGGIHIEDATVTLTGVNIAHCISLNGGGGGLGGGIFARTSTISLIKSFIMENVSGTNNWIGNQQPGLGGGIYISGGRCEAHCLSVIGNEAISGFLEGGSGDRIITGRGGGLYINCRNTRCQNLLSYGNRASRGGEIYIVLASVDGEDGLEINNSSLWNIRGEALRWTGIEPVIRNSIIGGTEDTIQSPSGIAKVVYSNVQGGYPGVGNINEDPLFVDPGSGDFRLQEGSPCIDSASTSGPATDLDGNPRPFDVPGVGTDGPGAFDMGAYEFIPVPTVAPTFVSERSDIDGSNRVDAKDLLILLSDWKAHTQPSR